jgi:sigma-54 dependent transcriptional regulator, acetoin dehydrogenase operon transcriptional activator AcoR
MFPVVEVEAARRSFLTAGRCMATPAVIRPEVVASWERSHDHDVDPDRIAARFVGHHGESPPVVACAEDVFDEFLAANGEAACSLALIDSSGVVRVRRDGDQTLGRLLDAVLLVPGYGYAERDVGTTAAAVAVHEQADVTVCGPEHYQSQLMCVNEAAARVIDPQDGRAVAVVVVLCHHSHGTSLQLPMARMLAARVAEHVAGEPHRRARRILEHFQRRAREGEWVLGTDGDYVLTNPLARHLDGQDLRVLSDLVLASVVLQDFARKHVDLPSGGCAEVAVEPVHMSGELIGCLLIGGPVGTVPSAEVAEAVRRQGSHIAPTTRRDYAEDLRRSDDAGREHAEARIRANRELLTPFLRAKEEVVASIKQGRNHLLIGEPGVGKRTLLLGRFRQAFPRGRIVTVDCGAFAAEHGDRRADPVARLLAGVDERPHLLLLRGMNTLGPVAARRLDESLRPLVVLPVPPLVVGCVDTSAVDATRPYGLLLRHFHAITRVPALRYRIDEIGDIALAILRRLSARRSLRLSLQVIRVLEGYAWPGNISELEDVLRYVVARKPLGEIQPPDLPALCFQGRARRMSMLETAQCDAIIQALYESRGNRYKAAAMLGIARSSLYRKIDAFGISYIA